MVGMEKDILILISRVRCMTENQVSKVFAPKKRNGKKPFKRTLRKMCNEYTLRKYPCNINYSGYKDNSYVYYLNGSNMYKGQELTKAVIGSEIAIKINLAGCELNRIYRNVSVANSKYDLFIEYTNKYGEPKQVLFDIAIDEDVNLLKYQNMEHKMRSCTIPFYEVPKVMVVTSQNIDKLEKRRDINCDVNFIDPSLSKLVRYI